MNKEPTCIRREKLERGGRGAFKCPFQARKVPPDVASCSLTAVVVLAGWLRLMERTISLFGPICGREAVPASLSYRPPP